MKKVTVFLAVVMLLALTVVSAFAYTSSITGIAKDSDTGADWAWGGDVYVYECSDTNTALNTPTAFTGANIDANFTEGISDRTLCVKITFKKENGDPVLNSDGSPVIKWQVIVDNAAAPAIADVGIVRTDSGPTAVTLQNVTADNNSTAVGIGFVVLMLAGVTFVMFRRREVA